MFSMIKFSIYFAISFAILCIPFGQDQRVFDALYSWARPYAKEVVTTTKQKIATTSKYSKKLFSNSTPTKNDNDEVTLTKSAIQRNDENLDSNNELTGNDDGLDLTTDETTENQTYTEEEKAQILKALKN